MEYITAIIKKTILSIILALIAVNCFSQTKANSTNCILGDWNCVKHDYRGYQNYSFEQAENIRKSVLHIDRTTFYFKNINFIDRCSFYEWQIKHYDMNLPIENMKIIYSKSELKKMSLVVPVDIKGNLACYNNCIVVL